MENRPFVSVVMPVYNVEKHLEKAVQSVLDQTYQNFEIILVDDCSPDNCPELCEKIAKSDERIQVLHHEVNQGLSCARNTGLAKAKGRYVWFMDSDDYVKNDLFEKAYKSVEQNEAKVILFGLVEDYYDANDELHHSIEIKEKAKNYIFIDEIQDIPGFEKIIRSLLLNEDNDIYITGSNAKMLSGELATYLSGR